jgi:hypothetical protein
MIGQSLVSEVLFDVHDTYTLNCASRSFGIVFFTLSRMHVSDVTIRIVRQWLTRV